MALTTIVKLLDKVTDAESFRAITLIILLLIGMMFFVGFSHLSDRIETNSTYIHHRIDVIEQGVIPRNEFMQMERRLDSFFEQLDKRLDRIEAKL
jgi:predicted PurR-regulated permease PerM